MLSFKKRVHLSAQKYNLHTTRCTFSNKDIDTVSAKNKYLYALLR